MSHHKGVLYPQQIRKTTPTMILRPANSVQYTVCSCILHAQGCAKFLMPISPPHLSPRNPHVELWQPWHEIKSGEELAVKSRKAMGVAIAVHICMEVLAAIARKHILRGNTYEARALYMEGGRMSLRSSRNMFPWLPGEQMSTESNLPSPSG